MLDIFNNDAFSVMPLSQLIIDLPILPTQLGDEGLFRERGIVSTQFAIERTGAKLNLVPSAPRGGVRQPIQQTNRKLIPIMATHLPQSGSVMADEVQGVRELGSETAVKTVQSLLRDKMQIMKDNMELTKEYLRVGALKGIVLDADGVTELWNMYTIFGFTQETQFFDIDTANSGVDLKAKCITLKRTIREKMGGRSVKRIRVKCSESWFDKFVGNDDMKARWALWQDGKFSREDQSEADFEIYGIVFQIYSGGTSAGDFIPADTAYAYPEGVPDMFNIVYSPAPYMETVNQIGQPYYAKQERMKFDVGVELESQSNPIVYNAFPEAVIKLVTAEA